LLRYRRASQLVICVTTKGDGSYSQDAAQAFNNFKSLKPVNGQS